MDIHQLYTTNKELKKSDVKLLENWMKTQPHLPKFDERMIIIIFHACYLNLESTKKCIEYYYSVRTSFPAMFADRDPESPHILQQFQLSFCEPFSKLTPKGHAVCYAKFLHGSAINYDFGTHVKLLDMRLHIWLRQFGCVEGGEMIVDMVGFTWEHWRKISFVKAMKSFGYLVEGFPFRIKGLHIVNPVYFLNIVLKVFYRFIPKELQQVVKIHNKVDTLFEVIPKYCIPNELGGTGGDTGQLHRNYIEIIRMNRDYFIEDEQMKSDESKRIKVGFFQRLGF